VKRSCCGREFHGGDGNGGCKGRHVSDDTTMMVMMMVMMMMMVVVVVVVMVAITQTCHVQQETLGPSQYLKTRE
jgi:uncharacterized membrane protein